MSPNSHLLKTFWHLALAGLAAIEGVTAKTRVRKFFCVGAAAWHIEAARSDFKDFREARRYEGNT